MVKNLLETWVQSLDREDPLEKGMATHSKFLPGESHGQRSLASYSPWGFKRAGQNGVTNTFTFRLRSFQLVSLLPSGLPDICIPPSVLSYQDTILLKSPNYSFLLALGI